MTPKRKKAERLADEELVPLIGDKDPQAFAVFYDRHGGVDAVMVTAEPRGGSDAPTSTPMVTLEMPRSQRPRARPGARPPGPDSLYYSRAERREADRTC